MADIAYKKIQASSQGFLFRQLSALLSGGMTAAEALSVLKHDLDDRPLEQLVEALETDAAAGKALSEALAHHALFAAELVELVRNAERSGGLPEVLAAIATDFEQRHLIRRNRWRTLLWPSATFGVLVAIIAFVMVFVIPIFKEVYVNFGSDLPAPTLFVIAIADVFAGSWLVFGVLLVAAAIALPRLRRSRRYGLAIDRLLLRLPGVRAVAQRFYVARVCNALAAAAGAKLPPRPAIGFLRTAIGNRHFEHALESVDHALQRGAGLLPALRESGSFPARALKMVEIGERSGKLADALAQASEYYGVQASEELLALEGKLAALLYVIFGVIVGVTVIAIYLPIFRMGAAI
ncbi:MAG: type II secretion system F family protein [Betaproteobacteria bacterium]|nr:type II secretion system F family protein [Betaproteobacteria bacterium]